MVPAFPTTGVIALATGVGILFTYFGYSFVTRLTSLFGGLGGALAGSVTARLLFPSPVVTAANFDIGLVSLCGALVGGLVGSYMARSLQQVAIAASCFVFGSLFLYWGLTHPEQARAISGIAPILDVASPVTFAVLFGGTVGLLVWKYYFLFTVGITSLLGASLLHQLLRQWSALLPLFHTETWTMLGTNPVLWLVLAGTGIFVQYRRYRNLRPRRILRQATAYRLR